MMLLDNYKLPITLGLFMCIIFPTAYGINWQWLEHSPAQSFTEQDWTLFRANVRTALDTLPDEASSDWANPESGNSGSIKILKSQTDDDDNYCRTAEINNHTAKQSGASISLLCRQADGSWKIKK